MTMDSNATSSIVRLNIGGYEFLTSVDTLTNREPQSMLAAMFSGRHTVYKDPEKGYVFVDRDGMHFRHILNWLRDGLTPNLSDVECSELLREAEYYQLLGLVEVLNKKKDEQMDAELTRADIIKYNIQYSRSGQVNLRGVNLSGLDLSKLDLSQFYFGSACLKKAILSGANLDRVSLMGANLQDASLISCYMSGADLRSAHLQRADLAGVNLEGANLEEANLKGANLKGAKLKGANLQRADLRDVRRNR
ncbi:putative chromatin remodeling & transcription regulator BTB-POZ family [Helianthus annuus]|uniref:FH protein interacting protein FIP2 isoform X2 n=1 Tax=Helianthus annuus TaxID=4232 RepID=UPI000B90172C|nr:FH protein interacting protein FIP2 isoform X2 [Helianthus annuus]KAJ0503153.1 putative chromatin remodeling & transcription regulator BTB-POZ family [Helianthus annuus]KAJ0519119.1 putative chromatin remodeling & transcription regulator BTB-POZ family [Helianthus annuus]KAJ0687112.1 putative chromatin remodeling & transcription regulator BTB-POZ family [Helianthus annuus]